MNILHSSRSHETLDYSPLPAELVVEVTHWVPIARTPSQFFVRSSSARMLMNYIRSIGLRTTLGKVRSRRRERLRNDKWCSLGFGSAALEEGKGRTLYPVVFFAPNHPHGVDRVSLPPEFVLETRLMKAATPIEVSVFAAPDDIPDRQLLSLSGWSPYSGVAIDAALVAKALRKLEPFLAAYVASNNAVARMPRTTVRTSVPASRLASSSLPRATLLGYGNFAKSVIIPSLRKLAQIDRVHDIDPTQLHPAPSAKMAYSTSPEIHPDDSSRLFLIATHHHMHTQLALQAMQRNACAVVEKPLATTVEQVASLEQAVADGGMLVSCFQRRYSALTRYAMEDLRESDAQAIDCVALIYQVSLPEGHWYSWPNSKSRLISNGCHWIDLFLHVNGYEEYVDWRAQLLPNGDFYTYCRLANGAQMQMRLTERGSHRLGVRDHVQLTNRTATATLIDDAFYECENDEKVLRRAHQNKISSYRAMYRHACGVALGAAPGDRVETLRSSSLSLALEAGLAPSLPKLELLRSDRRE